MGRGIPREVEWGIGLAFVIGMVILLVLAINTFEGPVTTILLVTAGVFFLVGVFFLSGTQVEPEARSEGVGSSAARQQAGVASGAPVTGPRPAATLSSCRGCGRPVNGAPNVCPHCGTPL